jgi:hypothetical protein
MIGWPRVWFGPNSGASFCCLKGRENGVKNNSVRFLLPVFVGLALLAVGSGSSAFQAQTTAQPADENYPNCRFGVTVESDVTGFDTAALNAGWYLNWGLEPSPPTPGGMEFVQMVRLTQVGADGWDFRSGETWESLTAAINANPGALWLIGNEPDSPYQDDLVPQAYANAYHDLHDFIKVQDPNAQVGIGGTVQPTPLRFLYLDDVWSAYSQTYTETMPVDVWNIHSFILREVTEPPDSDPCDPTPFQVWGAFFPPWPTVDEVDLSELYGNLYGKLYCVRDQDNLALYLERIRDFRQWMAENGQREKPLIITEYGVLFPEDIGYADEDGRIFSQTRVGEFMTGTYDLMLEQTDPNLGYPHDGNRLVQRWAWFSLNGDPFEMGGTLFDPQTHEIRELGETFRDYTSAITPTADLMPAQIFAASGVLWHEDAPVTAKLKAVVSNVGNISSTSAATVTFLDGPPDDPGTEPIGTPQVVGPGLAGCAGYEIVETEWTGLGAGAHPFYVQVSALDGDPQTNNVAKGSVLVAVERYFMPILARAPK